LSITHRETFSILNLSIERVLFDSGLTLLLQPGGRAPVCSFQSWIRSGSMHDPIDRSGLAHFFEHLMFTGTSRFPDGDLDHWVEENGGQINAATWLDWTYYHAELPSESVLDFVEREADRFVHLSLDPDRFERERQVVLSERREQVEGEPESLLSEMLWSGVLPHDTYGRPTIGTTEDIGQISRQDCLDYYLNAYEPGNMIIVVSGAFEVDALVKRVAAAFPTRDRLNLPDPTRSSDGQYCAGFKGEISLPSRGEKLYLGLPSPAVDSLDFAALEVVHHTLLEGETGRIQRHLINEAELVTYASGFLPSLMHQSLYEMGFDLRREVIAEDILELVRSHFETLFEEGISQRELDRARNRIELDVIEGLQTVEQRAHSIGFWEVVTGDCRRSATRLEQYRALDRDTVNTVIRKWWSPDRLSWTIGRCQND
jgi:zinc protease